MEKKNIVLRKKLAKAIQKNLNEKNFNTVSCLFETVDGQIEEQLERVDTAGEKAYEAIMRI